MSAHRHSDYREHLLAWRKQADHYAAKIKILITSMVPDARHRRDLFIKVHRVIDTVQDFIMVHAGNIQQARRSLINSDVMSPLKNTLFLRLRSLLCALPDAIVTRLRISDLPLFLLKG